MATSDEDAHKRVLSPGLYFGRADTLDAAIREAVSVIPEDHVGRRREAGSTGLDDDAAVFVVTSISVEVRGDPNVGAYSVTVM